MDAPNTRSQQEVETIRRRCQEVNSNVCLSVWDECQTKKCCVTAQSRFNPDVQLHVRRALDDITATGLQSAGESLEEDDGYISLQPWVQY